MTTTSIQVLNIHCQGCARNVQDTIGKLAGVETVEVDLETRTITVKHDGTADENEMIRTLDRMGYPQADQQSLLKQAKSYVSCAIGRIK
ncbi:MAG: heavy-metal-associated domain-containing protein [Bacteroidetes bacterium]|nr:MAG: heavy-metal-associated domain-containing protein [Bacteroidota bacterium]